MIFCKTTHDTSMNSTELFTIQLFSSYSNRMFKLTFKKTLFTIIS